jgi:hypothetical protein
MSNNSSANSGINSIPTKSGRKAKLIKIWVLILLTAIIITGYGGLCGSATGISNTSSGSSGGTFLIITNHATNITQTSANLNGRINPNGINTSAYFKYGTTPACLNSTLFHFKGAGTNDVVVTGLVRGLLENTQYYFKLVAIRGGNTSSGSTLNFTTASLPPTCTTKAANNITTHSARLNGTVNPNGVAANTYFNYGLTTLYTVTTNYQNIDSGINNVTVTENVTSLTSNTTYNFRIVATNNGGTTYGNNLIFVTGNSPGSRPTCITDAASDITANVARLNGTVNPNALHTDAYFEYGLTASYTVTTTSQPIGNGTMSVAVTADISGLSLNTAYNFRVVGVNTTGTTYGNNLTFTTALPPTCTTDAADNITSNAARLNGTVNPNGFATTACFNYGSTTSYTIKTNAHSIGTGTSNVAVSADISELSSNTIYNFRCVATNIGGTTYGANRTFGHWSQTTFPSGNGASGVFANTLSANSNNDIVISPTANWLQRCSTTTVMPTARYSHAMAYDSVRQRTVLFGGCDDQGVYNDETWEWDGTDWLQCYSTTVTPSARAQHAMAYDSVRQRIVLFGGWNGSVGNNETWEWDGTGWFQCYSTTVTPTAQYLHKMVYDSVRQRTVLFGGYDVNGIDNNETWEWDGTNWLQRYSTTGTPTARYNHAMAYDSVRQRTVLFGGYNGSINNNETWEWDGTSWLQRYSTTVTPMARRCHAMVYDSVRQRTVIFGGYTSSYNNQTWEWNGTNWTQQNATTSPTAVYSHAMAYDSVRQRTVLFGGNTSGPNSDQTWEGGLLYVSSGTYVSESIVPTSISSWGVLTFTYNAPANTTFTVYVLRSSDNSVLVTNVQSGTNLSIYPALNGVTSIKLRANFSTTDTNVTPTLSDWGVGYEGQ